MSQKLTAKRLRQVLDYNPRTGVFTWKEKIGHRTAVGERAGSQESAGYRTIGIDGVRSLEHRLAVLHQTGKWPRRIVTHKNGDRSDNRWKNLIECARGELPARAA